MARNWLKKYAGFADGKSNDGLPEAVGNMTKKTCKHLNYKDFSETTVNDYLASQEEYTRSMTQRLDFTCFDILSITRADVAQAYTRQFAHPKVDTQAYRISAAAAEQLVNACIRKYKNN